MSEGDEGEGSRLSMGIRANSCAATLAGSMSHGATE